jgi:CYTH domain-containing protein
MAHVTGTSNTIKVDIGQPTFRLSLNTEKFTTLVRSNLSCHMNKTLTQELMEQLAAQIVESIDYFINKNDDNL